MKSVLRLALVLLILSYGAAAHSATVLVDGDWLQSRLTDKQIVLVDMSTDSTQYQRFHLPGAVHLPYKYLVERRRDGITVRTSTGRLVQILGFLGITHDSHVVIYDDMGGLNAGRLFWELERIGHQKVSVLDGGLVQWILDGRKVSSKPVEPVRTVYQRAESKGRDNEALLDDVVKAQAGGEVRLLDVRTQEEYVGSKKVNRSGHIPGAQWWPWEETVSFEQGFRAKPSQELQLGLDKLNVDREGAVIAYCRTGHRASQSYLMLRSLGYENVKLYDGSMAEWSRNSKLPMSLGGQL
jgi:thiosulfate/3-mercaptopyruvate sulfurtransferase